MNKVRVGIIGGFQNGKSTLVNCMLDEKVAKTGGYGLSVTNVVTRYTFGDYTSVQFLSNGIPVGECKLHEYLEMETLPDNTNEVAISLWKPILKNIDLFDTPGFKASTNDDDITFNAIDKFDFIILLVNNKGLDSYENWLLNVLEESRKPFIVLVNCLSQGSAQWDPMIPQNLAILSEIEGRIENIGIRPILIAGRKIWPCNLLWYWFASGNYLSDAVEEQEKVKTQLTFFLSHFIQLDVADHKTIAEKSRFMEIRSLFEQDQFGFPLNFIRWSGRIDSTFKKWEKDIVKLIEKL